MPDYRCILLAVLTGFAFGFLQAIPVGPINLTVMNEGARCGFGRAMVIGLGATAAEALYCFIAFTGLAPFFVRPYVKAGMELFSFAFMLFLGFKFLLARSVRAPAPLGAVAERIEERIEQRLHPTSAFMIGLVRVMGNVGVLVFWVFMAAYFISREWVTADWPGKLSCVAGVALGTGFWFVLLSVVAARGHGKFSETTLLRMERLSGVGLLALALVHGAYIITHLARRPA